MPSPSPSSPRAALLAPVLLAFAASPLAPLSAHARTVAPTTPSAGAPSPPSVIPESAPRLARARALLTASLTALAGSPTRQHLAEAHQAMRQIEAGMDTYFHGPAPASPEARTHFVALRAEVMRLIGGEQPAVVVADDVLRFRPALHRQLAAVAQKLGDFRAAVEHLRAAEAVDGPQPDDLTALAAAYRAAGDKDAAQAAEAELKALPKGPTATP